MNDQIVITYPPRLSPAIVNDLEKELRQGGITVARRVTPPLDYVAGVDWLMYTAVYLVIAKPYCDAFFAEAGKHHYDVLRRIGARCWDAFFSKEPEYRYDLTDSKGVARESAYSQTFSVTSEMRDGRPIKLLLPSSIQRDKVGEFIGIFANEIGSYRSTGQSDVLASMLEKGPMGGVYLVTVDHRGKLVEVDVVPSELLSEE